MSIGSYFSHSHNLVRTVGAGYLILDEINLHLGLNGKFA